MRVQLDVENHGTLDNKLVNTISELENMTWLESWYQSLSQ